MLGAFTVIKYNRGVIMAKKNIFIVDDEAHICELIQYNLVKDGYETKIFLNGEDLLSNLENEIPDMIILDLMLPKIDGMEICRLLRGKAETKDIPIIMLTAKSEEIDRVLGLEMGADDYITKPFSVRELLARVKAIFRRTDQKDVKIHDISIIKAGDITVNLNKREVYKNNELIQLTLKEFELLYLLLMNKGNVLSRKFLLDKIWGYDYYGETRTVDVHIRNLRKLLDDKESNYIETVRGIGYKFREQV